MSLTDSLLIRLVLAFGCFLPLLLPLALLLAEREGFESDGGNALSRFKNADPPIRPGIRVDWSLPRTPHNTGGLCRRYGEISGFEQPI
jgi:hypothetical protein